MFNSLPTLQGATPCRPVAGEVDHADMEFTPLATFGTPNTSAETFAETLAEENARLRHVLKAFAAVGTVYRAQGRPLSSVVLTAEHPDLPIAEILSARNFTEAADAIK